MDYKNVSLFFDSQNRANDPASVANKLDEAMNGWARHGYEVVAVTPIPSINDSTIVVVSMAKRPDDEDDAE